MTRYLLMWCINFLKSALLECNSYTITLIHCKYTIQRSLVTLFSSAAIFQFENLPITPKVPLPVYSSPYSHLQCEATTDFALSLYKFALLKYFKHVSFDCWIILHFMEVLHFKNPLTGWWTFKLFPVWAIMSNTVMNIHLHVFACTCVFISLT